VPEITEALRAQLQSLVDDNEVLLFMKGSRSFPQCGFSATVVQILDEYLPAYETVNVLADPEVRSGVKDFSDWPTIPQLYVKGEFVGGCDIVREMHETGELKDVLGTGPMEIKAPDITITPPAAAAFKDAKEGEEHPYLRLEIGPQFQYALSFGPALDGDLVVETEGLEVHVDRASARRADGMTIDFVDGPKGQGFKIDNPNEPPKVQPMSAEELKAKLEAGETIHHFDVRTPAEREIVHMEDSVLLDEEAQKKILELDKDEPLLFSCHTGMRSMSAAQHFLMQGFRKVFNLTGGIDAWAQINPGTPRY
jgi:monothiol glutaredoxin